MIESEVQHPDDDTDIGKRKSGGNTVFFLSILLCVLSFTTNFVWGAPPRFALSEGLQQKEDNFQSTITSATASAAFTSASSACLRLDHKFDYNSSPQNDDFQNLDAILSRHRQVFVTMPAKASGTSLKRFSRKCNGQPVPSNFIDSDWKRKQFLSQNLTLPSIVTSHVKADKPLIHLATHNNRETLIIYVHRDELERFKSAIGMVLTYRVCEFNQPYTNESAVMKSFEMDLNETHCVLEEGAVIRLISDMPEEILWGTSRSLTCNTYDAIQENDPNFVVIHYKQSDQLQKLLAKHHCPELLETMDDIGGIHANVAKDKQLQPYIRVCDNLIVSLQEWLREKSPVLEWSLNVRTKASCQGKTKHMEDALFACPDEALQVTSTLVSQW
jgi:hypothetical protein